MTPDEAQIDVLMRRYAKRPEGGSASEHLDADELNAFAEGALPAAARSSYVSHLAECDDCRTLATQLTMAAGVDRAAVAGAGPVGTESLWRKLTAFFATPALRYTAFASVLIVAAGVVFFSLRSPRDGSLIASRETVNQAPASAVQPQTVDDNSAKPSASIQANAGKPEDVQKSLDEKTSGLKAGETAPSPASDTLVASSKSAPLTPERRGGEPSSAPASPSYAPPPPGEADSVAGILKSRGRDEPKPTSASGPRKADSDYKLKTESPAQGNEVAKDNRGDDESRARNQSSQNRVQQRESPRPAGPMLSRNQQSNDTAGNATFGASRSEAEKKQAPQKEEQPKEISVSGHKFRRQGDMWVDEKFKSSMSITNIARGSDGFRALDSSVRSIAEQLGGAVIVVSKGKAYRIQ